MDKTNDARAERLAAKLRENLKRRKAQARDMAGDTSAPVRVGRTESLPDEPGDQ